MKKNKQQHGRFYSEEYLLTMISEAYSLKESLEQTELELMAKQELLDSQLCAVEEQIRDLEKELEKNEK